MDHPNNVDRALTAALRAVAEDDARRQASPEVEARLRAEVRAQAGARRSRVTWLAVAASLTIAAIVPAYRVFLQRAASVSVPTTVSAAEETTAFLPLAYNDVPTTDGQLVRLEVSRENLVSLGLSPLDLVNVGSSPTVLADVLVGQDGLARAVRFVRSANAE